jgi:trk system potassium uptake protein TrkA
MRITIIGAGILGKELAVSFSDEDHDVVIVDKDPIKLDILREHHDVMTYCGNGATAKTLNEIEIEDCDMLIAVTGDDATNILTCQLAKKFAVNKTICRLSSDEIFCYENGITPETLGLEDIVVPELECVNKIYDAVNNYYIIERIRFSNPNAILSAFEVNSSSPLVKQKLLDLAKHDITKNIRIVAIVRNGVRISPRGNTVIKKKDEVYVAGHRTKVDEFIYWATTNSIRVNRVVIAGATKMGQTLAKKLSNDSLDVRVIDINRFRGEQLLDNVDSDIMVICGDTTEKEVLEEAGIDSTDIFISALNDDEDNILSCILAKKMGAKKVITITNKSEYIDIVPSINMIDCGFSASLIASNTVLRNFNSMERTITIEAVIHRINSYLYEFLVTSNSRCKGKKIKDLNCPDEATFALVFRNNEVLSATGDFEFQVGDVAAVIASPVLEKELKKLFSKKGLF